MKVTKLVPNENVTWLGVPESHGWEDHIFTFALDENEGKTGSFFTFRLDRTRRFLCKLLFQLGKIYGKPSSAMPNRTW